MRRKLLSMINQAMGGQPEETLDPIVSDFAGGINSVDDPENLPNNEFPVIINYDFRDGVLTSRDGFTEDSVTAPDSLRVLGLFGIRRFDGSISTLRFTKSSIHKLSGGAWVAITGPALGGGDYDRWTCFSVEDRVFASNGVNVLYELNLTANTYAAAGNAREYKYYCVANRRICAANYVGGSVNPIEFATSGNRNFAQWDPATDISSYRNSLVDAEESTSDEMTGLFGIKDSVVVLRSRSIWVGTPQPIASTPFAFRKVVSGIGCTCPGSAAKVSNDSIIFFDPTTQQVYRFELRDDGSVALDKIGDKVYKTIYSKVREIRLVTAGYDLERDEYNLFIEGSFGIFSCLYKYLLADKMWLFDEFQATNPYYPIAVAFPFISNPSGTIDALTGTIDGLTGTIDGLSSTSTHDARKYLLRSDGKIGYQDSAAQTDMGFSYVRRILSKKYRIPNMKLYLQKLSLALWFNGFLIFRVFKENRAQPAFISTKATFSADTHLTYTYRPNVHCTSFQWDVQLSNDYRSIFRRYELVIHPAGEY